MAEIRTSRGSRIRTTGRAMLVLSMLVVLPSIALAHGGGLDANGGHTNRKTGEYHCHRCPCGCSGQATTGAGPAPSSGPKASTGAAPSPAGAAGLQPLTGAAGAARSDPQAATVCVTKSGKKYHRPTCRHAQTCVKTMTQAEAQAAGYTPCSLCNQR